MMRLTLLAVLLAPALAGAQDKDKDKPSPYGDLGDFKLLKPEDKVDQPSVPPPPGAIVLFDGKNLDNWLKKDGAAPAAWDIVGGAMQVKGGDIITKDKFSGRFKLHVEFRVPYEPNQSGQGRGNSGVYLQGRYEVQVLDSYGLKSQMGDCGGLYMVAAPKVNVCKAPTVWQSYDIDFTSPACEDGVPFAPARMTVVHNGVKIHDDQPMVQKKGDQEIIVTNTTSGLGGDPCMPGPIMLQDHGHPVQYRNIWLVQVHSAPKKKMTPLDFNNFLAKANQRLAKAGMGFGMDLGQALMNGGEAQYKKMDASYASMVKELEALKKEVKAFPVEGIDGAAALRDVYEGFLKGQDQLIRKDFQEAIQVIKNATLEAADKQQRIQEIMVRVQGVESTDLQILQRAQRDFAAKHNIQLK